MSRGGLDFVSNLSLESNLILPVSNKGLIELLFSKTKLGTMDSGSTY